MVTTPRLYTVEEVAELLSLSPDTVYRHLRRGEWDFGIRFGRSWRIPAHALDSWIDQQCGQAAVNQPRNGNQANSSAGSQLSNGSR